MRHHVACGGSSTSTSTPWILSRGRSSGSSSAGRFVRNAAVSTVSPAAVGSGRAAPSTPRTRGPSSVTVVTPPDSTSSVKSV